MSVVEVMYAEGGTYTRRSLVLQALVLRNVLRNCMVRVGLVGIGFGSHFCSGVRFVKVEYMVRGVQTGTDVGEMDGS
jgi:hypothetical protein